MEDLAPKGDEAIAKQLAEVENALGVLEKALSERSNGDTGKIFYGGDSPMFVDVVLAADLINLRNMCGDEHPVIKLVFGTDGGRLKKLVDAFSKWAVVH